MNDYFITAELTRNPWSGGVESAETCFKRRWFVDNGQMMFFTFAKWPRSTTTTGIGCTAGILGGKITLFHSPPRNMWVTARAISELATEGIVIHVAKDMMKPALHIFQKGDTRHTAVAVVPVSSALSHLALPSSLREVAPNVA